jgi:hypothetical protein
VIAEPDIWDRGVFWKGACGVITVFACLTIKEGRSGGNVAYKTECIVGSWKHIEYRVAKTGLGEESYTIVTILPTFPRGGPHLIEILITIDVLSHVAMNVCSVSKT